MLADKLQGVFPALATLLDEDGRPDAAAMEHVLGRMLASGVQGITVLGTAGEGVVLPPDVRDEAVRITVTAVAGRVPVLAGIGENYADASCRQVERVARLGADGVLVLPPFYYPLPQKALQQFFTEVARRSAVPLLMYNIAPYTKNGLRPETVRALAQEPGILGMKDSTGDFTDFQAFVAAQSATFKVFQGKGAHVLAGYLVGAAGSITPITNLHPEWEVGLHQAVLAGDLGRAKALQRQATALAGLFTYHGHPLPVNLKALMALAGLGRRQSAASGVPLDETELSELRSRYTALD